MTVLDEGIIAYLKAYTGLTALISTRIYPVQFPDGVTMPCVVYQRVDTPRTLTMQSSGATGDLTNPRFQFRAWATTYASAKAITDQIRAALNGRTGSTGAGTVTVTLRASLAGNETDGFDPNVRLYYRVSDFVIWFEE
jgi:hypothetical protein